MPGGRGRRLRRPVLLARLRLHRRSATPPTDLICRELDGEDISERLEYFNDFYLRTFDYVLSKYEDQYPVFGNVWVTAHKLHLDGFYNHTGVVLLAVQNKLTNFSSSGAWRTTWTGSSGSR